MKIYEDILTHTGKISFLVHTGKFLVEKSWNTFYIGMEKGGGMDLNVSSPLYPGDGSPVFKKIRGRARLFTKLSPCARWFNLGHARN
jgi:hypothetical protein